MLQINPVLRVLAAVLTVSLSACGGSTGSGGIGISIGDLSVNEGDSGVTAVQVTVSLAQAAQADITVDYATGNESAVAGSDYSAATGTLTFAAGQTTQTIPVDVLGDTADENDEVFSVTLSNPSSNARITRDTALITIENDDAASALPSIRVLDAAQSENGGSLAFTIELSDVATSNVTVGYNTQGASATADTDFQTSSGTATIPAGSDSVTVSIPLLDDTLDESNETFNLVLNSPNGATLGDASGRGTIQDDDPSPTVSIVNASIPEGDSGTKMLDFSVQLSEPSGRAITVAYQTVAASAAPGSDFVATQGQVTFDPGVTEQTVAVEIVGDTLAEGDESLLVVLGSPSNAAIADANAVGVIEGDDQSGTDPRLTVDDLTLTEGATGALTVSLSAPATGATSVNYATFSGSAGSADFTAASGQIDFAVGESQQTINIATAQDLIDEPEESFSVVLSGISGPAALQDGTAIVMITDDDPTPTLSVTDQTFSEGSSASLLVELSGPSAQPVQFDYDSIAGTATAGVDYQSVSGTAIVDAGDTSVSLPVTINDDTLAEATETFTLVISNPAGANLGDATGVISISDDENQPSLSVANALADEGDGTLSFLVTLSAQSQQTVTVDYSLNGVTATPGADYQNSSATLSFPAGTTSRSVLVTLLDDTEDEGDETLELVLSNPSNAVLGDNLGVGTIADNDDTLTLAVADASVVEGDSGSKPMTFNFVLSGTSTSAVTVQYNLQDGSASAGDDYTDASGTVTIPAGSQSTTLTVDIIGDQLAEGAESFTLSLANPAGAVLANASATGTIQDNEGQPSLVIADAAVAEGTGGSTTMQFAVSLSPAAADTVTVNYGVQSGTAAAGQDFTSTSGTLSFAAGETSKSFNVSITTDSLDENAESFTATLSNASGATIADSQAAGVINDDDAPPVLAIGDLTVSESVGTAGLTISLGAPSGKTVSVTYSTSNGTAAAGSDFTSTSSTVSIAPGALSTTASVAITDDASDESDESFTVGLSAPVNATIGDQTATVTITDNDAAPSLSIADLSVNEGNSGSSNANVQVTLSAASAGSVTVNYATGNGSATAGSDYTARSGSLTFVAGDTQETISVPVLGDASDENNETFTVTLSGASGATIADSSATVTIQDDDGGIGLAARPSNTTCVAPARTTSPATWTLVDAFPDLPNLSTPMKMIQPPNDSSVFYVLERAGTLKRFSNSAAASSAETYLSITVSTEGEGGFLGAAFHPNWPATKEIFVSYYLNSGGRKTQLSRLVITNDATLPATYTEEALVTVDQPFSNHNGGDLYVGPDDNLYWAVGDGGSANDPNNNGLDTTTLLGNILRIDAVDVAYPSPGYNIPVGNPFRGNAKCGSGSNADDCPEIYAYGLRNPWRMSFDQANGTLWVGDVGQDRHEEVDIITAGGNYGWKTCEGSFLRGTVSTPCNNAAFEDPVWDYPHGDGNGSITGGFVYRGSDLPELVGKYLYADYLSGRIWTLTPAGGGSYTNALLLDTTARIHSFSQGNDGEVYVLNISSSRISKLQQSGGVTNDNVPASLVDTGCVSAADPTQPAAGLVPYAPVAPFWSDGADKSRWIALPNGATIDVDGRDDFSFPNGTVIMKNFELGGQLVETRLLMRHPDGDWAGYSYEWNSAVTVATRNDAGSTRSVNGQLWIYPSQAECEVCHTDVAGHALGPETAQLNADFLYPSTGITDNQLEVYNHIGMFSVDLPEPVSLNPALVDPFDAAESLEDRARAYLHTNCANCHASGGPTPVSLDLDYRTPFAGTGTCNVAPSAGEVGINPAVARLIAPGSAANSVLIERMSRRDLNGMPPLGSNLVDTAGVQLITDWVNSLSGCP